MRGIVKRKSHNQPVIVSGRTAKVIVSSLLLSLMILVFFNPVQAKAEDRKDVNLAGYEKPIVNTETEYHTEYNPTVTLPSINAEDNTLEWDVKVNDNDTVQEFSENQTIQPERDKEKFSLPVSIDLNQQYKELSQQYKEISQQYQGLNQYYQGLSQYYKELGIRLRSERTVILQTATNQLLAMKDIIAQKKAPRLPVTAFPASDVNTEGDLIALVKITVSVKISGDSQLVTNKVNNNGITTSEQEVDAVFCAVQKQNRWITRKQTLF